jgi:CRISP-associated protein Cas1
VAAGLDPTIDIINGNSSSRIPLVYDLMEPMRPIVDRAVLEFTLSNTLTPGDFTISQWGGCRLNPRMAKVVAGLVAMNADRAVKEFSGNCSS